jgi:hypothetical protein
MAELKWILGIVAVIAILMVFTGHLGGTINIQSMQPGQVSFRTDVVAGVYQASNKYIAVDYDDDGALECFVYSSTYSSWQQGSYVPFAQTPEGYGVFKYGTTSNILIKIGSYPVYSPTTSCGIPLAALPTEPYTANGQEMVEGGACVPNCAGKCGGAGDGCSGTCDVACSGGAFVCDSDGNGKISRIELGNTIAKWVGG